jgi:hypothetical protein
MSGEKVSWQLNYCRIVEWAHKLNVLVLSMFENLYNLHELCK